MKTKLLLSILLFVAILTSCNLKVKNELVVNEVAPTDTLTKLIIVNGSDSAVTVWITLGATQGCLQSIGEIPYITDSLSNLVGSFVLGAGDSTEAYAPIGMGFNGNITINSQPLNCPTPQVPNGVNIFEFIINNSYQTGIPQETIDISCVAGVNSSFKAYLTGGNAWNAGSTIPQVDSIYNEGLIGNSGLVGVYPYGCDTCTGAKTPPSCITTSTDKQKQSICNVQRNAVGSGGGFITVVYLGAK